MRGKMIMGRSFGRLSGESLSDIVAPRGGVYVGARVDL
jgi:hypothetical protein